MIIYSRYSTIYFNRTALAYAIMQNIHNAIEYIILSKGLVPATKARKQGTTFTLASDTYVRKYKNLILLLALDQITSYLKLQIKLYI